MPFTEAIPVIQWTFEQLLKLLDKDYKTKKDRFEKIFDSAYMNMTAIHRDYISMFNKTLGILPTHIDESKNISYITKFDKQNKPIEFLVQTTIGSEEYLENIKIARKIIIEDRDTNDILRIEARSLSAKIIEKGHNKFEKRFCWSLLHYFLDHRFYDEIKEEDKFLEDLVVGGADRMTDTPSYLATTKMFEENKSEKIKESINKIKLQLGDKFTNISSKYLDLKLHTYQ